MGADGLDALIRHLRDDGRTVIGPVVRDGVITHDEVEHGDELPRGWTDDQEGGHYRLEPTGTDEVFAWATPSTAWKRYLQPEQTLLVRARRTDGAIEILDEPPSAPRFAFFGIRSCDLAALGILDKVFLDPDATDPTYAARRAVDECPSPPAATLVRTRVLGPTPRTH